MAQHTPYSSEAQRSKSGDVRTTASEQMEKVTSQVEGAVREVSSDVQAVAGNIKSAVDTSVKDKPMATLAVAAVLGFVMGALWKS